MSPNGRSNQITSFSDSLRTTAEGGLGTWHRGTHRRGPLLDYGRPDCAGHRRCAWGATGAGSTGGHARCSGCHGVRCRVAETQNRHEAESDDGGQTTEIAGNRDAGECGHVSGETLIVDGRGGRETTVSGWNEFLSFAELHFPTLGCDLQQVQQRRGPTWDEIRAAEDRLRRPRS